MTPEPRPDHHHVRSGDVDLYWNDADEFDLPATITVQREVPSDTDDR